MGGVGAADMAFPRMNNWSFWLLPVAGLFLMSSFFLPGGAVAGKRDILDRIDHDATAAKKIERILHPGTYNANPLSAAAAVTATTGGLGNIPVSLAEDAAAVFISIAAIALLGIGGLFLGPLVQKAAFGAYWTGWPFGTDLTDNKTAVAVLAWVVAAFRARGGRDARLAVGVAALVTLAVFMVPHSAWGSQVDWSKLPPPG